MGDAIQFIRYAALVKERGGQVVVESHRALIPLLETCPGVDRLVARGDPLPDFDVHSLVYSIAEIQRDAPLRIDGEIIFPDGSAVNWRELWNARQAADGATVLAKTVESVQLLDVASLASVGGRA